MNPALYAGPGAGLGLIEALQRLSPALDGPMRAITALGATEFYLLLIPLLYWLRSPGLALRLLIPLTIAAATTDLLKVALHQPRPYWLDLVDGLDHEGSYGLPSGHASTSLTVWGRLAATVQRHWFTALGLVLVGLIGLSRLYLGVHFLHDVLAGWLLALALLWLLRRLEGPVGRWLDRQTLAGWLWASLGGGLALVVAGLLAGQLASGRADPSGWLWFLSEGNHQARFFTGAGALVGATTGYRLMQAYAPYRLVTDWRRRSLGLLLGVTSLLLLWRGLGSLLPLLASEGTLLNDTLRLLRAALVTLLATLVVPALWGRLHLADPPTAPPRP